MNALIAGGPHERTNIAWEQPPGRRMHDNGLETIPGPRTACSLPLARHRIIHYAQAR